MTDSASTAAVSDESDPRQASTQQQGPRTPIPPTDAHIRREPDKECRAVLRAMRRIVERQPKRVQPGQFDLAKLADEAEVTYAQFYRKDSMIRLREDWQEWVDSTDTTSEKEREQATKIHELKQEVAKHRRISSEHREKEKQWREAAESLLQTVVQCQEEIARLNGEVERYKTRRASGQDRPGGESTVVYMRDPFKPE